MFKNVWMGLEGCHTKSVNLVINMLKFNHTYPSLP